MLALESTVSYSINMNNAATTQNLSDLLGAWKLNGKTAVFAHLDADYVWIDNHATHRCFVLSTADALAMIDGMRDAGWRR